MKNKSTIDDALEKQKGEDEIEYPKLTKNEKRELIENILSLDREQRILIIRVIRKYQIPYDKNRIGIYTEINNFPKKVLFMVKSFVDSCIDNKRLAEERYEYMKAAKKDLSDIPLGGVVNNKFEPKPFINVDLHPIEGEGSQGSDEEDSDYEGSGGSEESSDFEILFSEDDEGESTDNMSKAQKLAMTMMVKIK